MQRFVLKNVFLFHSLAVTGSFPFSSTLQFVSNSFFWQIKISRKFATNETKASDWSKSKSWITFKLNGKLSLVQKLFSVQAIKILLLPTNKSSAGIWLVPIKKQGSYWSRVTNYKQSSALALEIKICPAHTFALILNL